MPAQFAPALSFSKIDPVRCLVAGPREARDLDKGLKKHWTISIACLPILGQPAGCHRQDPGGQVLALNPGQYQEAGVVYHQMESALTLLGGPADETIPWSYFPGCGPEPHQSENRCTGCGNIAQLCPRQRVVAQVVVPIDVFIPQV
jgi:hypothetical protein